MNGERARRVERCGVCYHPDVAGAEQLAQRLCDQAAEAGCDVWMAALERDGNTPGNGGAVAEHLPGSDLLVCVGGDGTMLQASGLASMLGVPVFGVRMGRLGFLAEATEGEAEAALGLILLGEGRIEERSMAQASVVDPSGESEAMHALNDVVIGRNRLGRTVTVGLRVDGVLLAEYRADAVVVATATGSTGYTLAISGPILYRCRPAPSCAAPARRASRASCGWAVSSSSTRTSRSGSAGCASTTSSTTTRWSENRSGGVMPITPRGSILYA